LVGQDLSSEPVVIMRFLRIAGRTLAILIGTLLVALVVVALWLTTSLPVWDGVQTDLPVAASVDIVRDRHGVTHIRAASDRDAYVALGFAHAQDRLWQMDTYRRIGAGRAAEVVGSPGLFVDRLMRTLGVYRLAERQIEHASPEVREAITAYAAGVNAYLERHQGPWPPEFTLLGYRPEPWRPADSAVLGKLLALMLGGNWFDEMRRAALIERVGPDKLDVLNPREGPHRAMLSALPGFDAQRLLSALPSWTQPRRASNAWAVTAERTSQGAPILASDPHLGMTAPGIWYLVRLETPTRSISGATIPGLPFHLLGQNEHVAWGLTTTYGDVSDLVVETTLDDDHYRTPEGSEAFRSREETIRVRFGRDVVLRIRESRHGPIVSDVIDRAAATAGAGRVAALQAVALQPDDTTPEALYRLQTASDAASFREALRLYHAPMQNVLYADRQGAIGFIAAGRAPIRASGDGSIPADGARGAAWTGYVPFDALPQKTNPDSGVLFNANNRVVADDYPYLISLDWEPAFRAERLRVLLAPSVPLDVASHAAFQNDTYSAAAATLLPALLQRLETMTARPAADLVADLRAWNFHMDRDSRAALVFAAWLPELTREIFADDLGELVSSL